MIILVERIMLLQEPLPPERDPAPQAAEYIYIYICMYIHVYIYIYTCIYIYTGVSPPRVPPAEGGELSGERLAAPLFDEYTYIYIYTYVYMYVCMYVCIYIYIYIYIIHTKYKKHNKLNICYSKWNISMLFLFFL